MKTFKNLISVLFISLLYFWLNNVFAISFTTLSSLNKINCDEYNWNSVLLKYDSSYNYFNTSNWSNSNVVSNKIDWQKFNSNNCNYSWGPYFSFLKLSTNNDNLIFSLYNYNSSYIDKIFSRAWYLHNFANWDAVILNNIRFWNGFIVLYDDDLTHTVQYFHDYYVENKVVFVDPLVSSVEDENIDNFYVIDFINKKAWWMKLVWDHINNLFQWNVWDYKIKDFPFTSSYTLTQWSSITPYPKFSSYMRDNYNKAYFKWDIWFLYSKDAEFVGPDFWGWDDNNINNDNNYFNSNIISWYNTCSNKAENLRKYLHLMWYCFWQSENWSLISDILASNWQYNYTWDLLYCKQLSDYNKKVYNQYSDNWNSDWTFNDVNLYDFNAPFNDLVYSWFNNSLTITQSWYVEGLPTQSMCSVYNNVNAYDNEKSRLERASESITDMFWSWVASNYIDAIKNWSSFSWFIWSITEWVSWFFNDYMFDPYIVEFNSWKNAFLDVVNVNSCSNIHQTIWNYQRGNVALYWFTLILLLVFITIF